MSIRIPNSNQFSIGDNGPAYEPSDFTYWTPGSSLPDTEENDIPGGHPINIKLALRRNQYETERKPKNFIPADRLLDLSYKKQIEYINTLDQKKLMSWYGASDQDIQAVKSYILQYGGTNIEIEKERRTAAFTMSYEQFRNAFLKGRDEIVTNISGDTLFYYSPENYANSYLTASGTGALEFASAIIGFTNEIENTAEEGKQAEAKAGKNQPYGSDMMYYPSELSRVYNFPSPDKTGAGKGVTIGLIGSGQNEFELLNQGNAFNKYLKAQGIDIRSLGRVNRVSNDPVDPQEEWGEFTLDYSVLRSIAPRADLIISDNSLFNGYQELIYNPKVDIISSSVGMKTVPGIINQNEAVHELFVDGLLRGKSIVVAAGDQGTGNYGDTLLPNGEPYADYWDGDSAFLSVGGTAFSPKAQLAGWPRATVERPTAPPPQYSKKTIDKITGLIDDQLMWNQYSYDEISGKKVDELVDELSVEVYPSLQSQFTMDDFIGASLVGGVFQNETGTSGVFNNAVQRMPGYQKRNLGPKWQGTGRRFPDVSVLAGSNTEEGVNSYYYVIGMKNEKPVLTSSGGTSAGAPLLAGLLANITSGLRKKFGKGAKTAFINPYLYEKYNSNQGKKLFIDVPSGSNNASTFQVASSTDQWQGHYAGVVSAPSFIGVNYILPLNGTGPSGTLDLNLSSTGKGFDAASGLGSIDGQALFDGLAQVWSTI